MTWMIGQAFGAAATCQSASGPKAVSAVIVDDLADTLNQSLVDVLQGICHVTYPDASPKRTLGEELSGVDEPAIGCRRQPTHRGGHSLRLPPEAPRGPSLRKPFLPS